MKYFFKIGERIETIDLNPEDLEGFNRDNPKITLINQTDLSPAQKKILDDQVKKEKRLQVSAKRQSLYRNGDMIDAIVKFLDSSNQKLPKDLKKEIDHWKKVKKENPFED